MGGQKRMEGDNGREWQIVRRGYKLLGYETNVMIWILWIQGLSHLDQFWSFWKAFRLMVLRVCSFLPSFGNMLNHLIELLQMFKPESSLSSPKSSPSALESLQQLIQEIAMITLALSLPFWDIHCIQGHLRPPSFIGIDSQSEKGSQTHCRCVGQLLAQMMGIPWQQASIRPIHVLHIFRTQPHFLLLTIPFI